MTDERLGDGLIPAIAALPKGAGVVFRHYSLGARDRRALFAAVRRVARRHRLTLLLADRPARARAWGADGSHGRHRDAVTAPVHSVRERIAAVRAGAALIFVSPVFPTQSHPGGRALGSLGALRVAGPARDRCVALGGMTLARAKRLDALGLYGWAAIDGLASRPPSPKGRQTHSSPNR